MKTTLFVAVVLGLAFGLVRPGVVRAQAPAWQMAVVASVANVAATATDASGNVFVAGNFVGTATFGSLTLTGLGAADGFVAKYSPASSSFVWAQRMGGTANDFVTGVAISGANVYVSGTFYSSAADFGGVTLATAGGGDAFVAKLTDAGPSASFAWAQRGGGTGNDTANGLAISGTSVYLSGSFPSTPATFGNLALGSTGAADIFVAKLTDAGSSASYVWVQQAGGAANDSGMALAANGQNVYLTGNFYSGTAIFGSITLTNSGALGPDIFVAKLTDAGATGSFVWAQRGGGTSFDFGTGIAVNGPNVYVGGTLYSSGATFGSIALPTGGVFVAKLVDAGVGSSFAWVQGGGTATAIQADALVASGANVYLAGSFSSSTLALGATTLTNASSSGNTSDVFVAKVVDGGSTSSFAWAQRAGGTGGDVTNGLAISSRGLIYQVGSVAPPASFGSMVITNAASQVGFLASLVDLTLGTAPGTLLAGVAFYPNPAHGRTTVQLPPIAGTPTATLTVLDALGRTVRTQTAATNANAELDLSGLAPGLYAVRVAAGSSSTTRRLVVE